MVTLNIHSGLRRKLETLRYWQETQFIDVLCLTECGDAGLAALCGPGVFVSQTLKNLHSGSCAIITALWLKQVCLLTAMANSIFVAVAVTLQTLMVMVVAAYVPHSPLKRPELAQTFWSGLTATVEGLPRPVVLGMDANYHACLHDTSSPNKWQDVEVWLPEVGEFWTVTALLDVHWVVNPGVEAHTFFAMREDSPLDTTNWSVVPTDQLLSHCCASSRIDMVAASELLVDGTQCWVLATLPVTTDHRPVMAEFPAVAVWAKAPQLRSITRVWTPEFAVVTKNNRFEYFQVVQHCLAQLEQEAPHLSLEELTDAFVDTLCMTAMEMLPGALKGGVAGHSHFIWLLTAYCQHLAQLKCVAIDPCQYRKKLLVFWFLEHGFPWFYSYSHHEGRHSTH